jgi:hypothetical protein
MPRSGYEIGRWKDWSGDFAPSGSRTGTLKAIRLAFCAADTFSRNGNVKIYSCEDAMAASVYEVSAAHASAFGIYGMPTFLALSFLNAIADLLKRFSDESLQVHHLCPLHL